MNLLKSLTNAGKSVACDSHATHAEHEAKCRKCGRCCYFTVFFGEELVITPFKCDFLDADSGLCTVYEQRHSVYPECLPIAVAISRGILPEDCPYVADIPGYKGPREMHEDEREAIISAGMET